MTATEDEENLAALDSYFLDLLRDPSKVRGHKIKDRTFRHAERIRGMMYFRPAILCKCGDMGSIIYIGDREVEENAGDRDKLFALADVAVERFFDQEKECILTTIDTTKPVIITIDIPSGKMVVDDDMRPHFDHTLEEDPEINYLPGRIKLMDNMASQGVAYGQVSNTSPDIWRTPDGTIFLANGGYTEEEDDVVPEGWEKLGGICTDLWAYHATDYDRYVAAGGTFDSSYTVVVDVEPGEYQFINWMEVEGFDPHGDIDDDEVYDEAPPTIFVEVRKVE